MPIENYSGMMMESDHMVVGDDVGGDDGGLEIPPLRRGKQDQSDP
jgi:hypothetical protein